MTEPTPQPEPRQREEGRPRPPRRPRQPSEGRAPRLQEQRQEGEGARATVPAFDYEGHLVGEHGLEIEVEPGWPTEVKRFTLVRPAQNRNPRQALTSHVGTRPEAVAFFYEYLHPQAVKRTGRRTAGRAA